MNYEARTVRSPAPAYQHPIARLIATGATALSNAELLAVIIRTGTVDEDAVHLAERILAHYDGLYGLAQAQTAELHALNGLSSSKTAQIVAALELSKRLVVSRPMEHPLIASAADAARYVEDMASLQQEHVRVILLDGSKRVISAPTLYIGTLNTSVIRIAEVYRDAISYSSPAIILAHNHPSGDPAPSPEDVELTRALETAGNLLDITFVDHIIIGKQRWASLRELGFLT